MSRRTTAVTRAHVALVAVAILVAPSAGEAQRVARIAFLCADNCSSLPTPRMPHDQAFLRGLELGGYTLGRNVWVDELGVGVGYDRLRQVAERLVERKVGVIVAVGNAEARAARQATRTTPIVMVNVVEPVDEGLVASLGRPGGNVTGLAVPYEQLATKHLQLLKEIQPRLARVAVLWNPGVGQRDRRLGRLEAAARSLGLETQPVEVATFRDLEKEIPSLAGRVDGLLILEHPTTLQGRGEIALFALRQRLPSVAADRQFVAAGGLIAYGPRLADQYGRAAAFVARLLSGAKAPTLPVEEPTRFELIVNKGTATALGLSIPGSLLLRADEVVP